MQYILKTFTYVPVLTFANWSMSVPILVDWSVSGLILVHVYADLTADWSMPALPMEVSQLSNLAGSVSCYYIMYHITLPTTPYLTFTTLWAFSADDKMMFFSCFSQKTGFDISCKLSP